MIYDMKRDQYEGMKEHTLVFHEQRDDDEEQEQGS